MEISGTPLSAGTTLVSIDAFNPVWGSVGQVHSLTVIDPSSFSSSMAIHVEADVLGADPKSLQNLVAQFDATKIVESNGTLIKQWLDTSGNLRNMDQVRGNPMLLESSNLSGKNIVRFDGHSQLFSTFDFSSILNEYSIFAVARHAGNQNKSVISSVGSNWTFGLGDDHSVYWKMGQDEFFGPNSNQNWHIYVGTFDAAGNLELIRDGFSVIQQSLTPSLDTKARRLSFGGLKLM